MSDNRNDVMRGAFAPDTEGCLGGDPYCSRNPSSHGTYEAYSGALCGACEEQQECSRCGRGTGRNICGSCADDLRGEPE